jgi:hypothetical protein
VDKLTGKVLASALAVIQWRMFLSANRHPLRRIML